MRNCSGVASSCALTAPVAPLTAMQSAAISRRGGIRLRIVLLPDRELWDQSGIDPCRVADFRAAREACEGKVEPLCNAAFLERVGLELDFGIPAGAAVFPCRARPAGRKVDADLH